MTGNFQERNKNIIEASYVVALEKVHITKTIYKLVKFDQILCSHGGGNCVGKCIKVKKREKDYILSNSEKGNNTKMNTCARTLHLFYIHMCTYIKHQTMEKTTRPKSAGQPCYRDMQVGGLHCFAISQNICI